MKMYQIYKGKKPKFSVLKRDFVCNYLSSLMCMKGKQICKLKSIIEELEL